MDMKWKTIKGHPKYEVSFCGSVRRKGGLPLKPRKKSNEYLQVVLYSEPQKPLYKYIHRLVAETWISDIPHKQQVNHKDGNKANNHVSNLEIVTASENMYHAYQNGLIKALGLVGRKHHKATTTEEEVLKIRADHNSVRSLKEICRLYPHLKEGTLRNIIYRQSWKHI